MDALPSQRTAAATAPSSQSLRIDVQTDSTATSPDKGPAPAHKDVYNKGHKVHRKPNSETGADKMLHSVESMHLQEREENLSMPSSSGSGCRKCILMA